MSIFKRLSYGIFGALFFFATLCILFPTKTPALSGSDFRADRIIDDSVFFDSTTMGTGDIQAFLNSRVPNCAQAPCLKNFSEDMNYFPADAYCGTVEAARKTAAQIIKDVATACSISPKVILVLLQKEQGIVDSTAPTGYMYTYATGFCVPDGPPPPACAGTYGFSNQVYYGARQYQKYAKQPNSFTYRAGQVGRINWSPNGGCGTSDVFIQNQATAGLYNYTPYRPNGAALNNLYGLGDGCSAYGNRNFWRMFSDWFGSTITDRCNYNTPGSAITSVAFRKLRPLVESGNFIIYSGSSTNCIESHTWGVGFNSWQSNVASNQPSISPADAVVHYADLNGDGIDEPILIAFNNTGSGMVEFHVWDSSLKRWVVHAISNLPTSAVANIAIAFADMDGNGVDDPIAIGYKNTGSGMVELHYWGAGVQNWKQHTISSLPAPLNPAEMQIKFGDIDGNGVDEAMAVGVSNTGSGKVEFHVWNPGLWSWRVHVVSNQSVINVANEQVDFADFDGDRIDNGVIVGTRNTGSGKVEFHVWNPGLTSWQGHYASNQAIL